MASSINASLLSNLTTHIKFNKSETNYIFLKSSNSSALSISDLSDSNEIGKSFMNFNTSNQAVDMQVPMNIMNTTDSIDITAGALVVSGGVGIEKNLNVGGIMKLSSTAQSTDTSTGALILRGGLAVQDKINVGKSVKISASGSSVNTYSYVNYPPALTSASSDGYTLSASSENSNSGRFIYHAFDQNINTFWQPNTTSYSNLGVYADNLSTEGYGGDWLQIQFPTAIQVHKFDIQPIQFDNGYYAPLKSPQAFKLFASNDGSSWTGLYEATGLSWTTATKTFTLNSPSSSYTYFRLVINVVGNDDVYSNFNRVNPSICQLSLYNYEVTGSQQSNVSINSTSLSTGALVVEGGVGIQDNLNAGGIVHLSNTTQSTSSSSGALIVDGGMGIVKNLNVSGAVDLNSTLNVDGVATVSNTIQSSSTSSGALIVSGGVAVQKNLNVGGAVDLDSTLNVDGVATVSNTTQSSSTSSGALIVSGGVAVQNNLNVGGAVDLNSTLNVDGVATVSNTSDATDVSTGALIVSGSMGLTKNMYIGGSIRFGGSATETLYPPAMTDNTFVNTSGTYIASASSYYVQYNLAPYQAFDGNPATFWQTGTQVYDNDGTYTGNFEQNGYYGEWIQLQMPAGIKLGKFSITPLVNVNGATLYAIYRSPRSFRLFGSNDGSSWTQLYNAVDVEWSSVDAKLFEVTGNSTSYSYYKFVVNKTGNASSGSNNEKRWLNINQIYLYDVIPSESNVEIDRDVTTLNNVTVEGVTSITNSTDSTNVNSGALVIAGGVGIQKNLSVGGSFILNNSTQSNDTSSGALVISGGLGVHMNTNINGITRIWNTTNATNTSTGSLIVSGGTSITKDLYVGGQTYKITGSSQLWSISSDKRIKENITDVELEKCIESLKTIRLRNYNYTPEYLQYHNLENNVQLGVIADELLQSHPDSVQIKDTERVGDSELNNFKTINMSKQIFELIGSVQFFASKIESLTSQIQSMQNVIDDLTQQLNNKQ